MPSGSRLGLYIESLAGHRFEPGRESENRNIALSNTLCQLPCLTRYSDPVVSPQACPSSPVSKPVIPGITSLIWSLYSVSALTAVTAVELWSVLSVSLYTGLSAR